MNLFPPLIILTKWPDVMQEFLDLVSLCIIRSGLNLNIVSDLWLHREDIYFFYISEDIGINGCDLYTWWRCDGKNYHCVRAIYIIPPIAKDSIQWPNPHIVWVSEWCCDAAAKMSSSFLHCQPWPAVPLGIQTVVSKGQSSSHSVYVIESVWSIWTPTLVKV